MLATLIPAIESAVAAELKALGAAQLHSFRIKGSKGRKWTVKANTIDEAFAIVRKVTGSNGALECSGGTLTQK